MTARHVTGESPVGARLRARRTARAVVLGQQLVEAVARDVEVGCLDIADPRAVGAEQLAGPVTTLLAVSQCPEPIDTAILLTFEAVTNTINACEPKGFLTPVTLYAG
ncbi:hypothetical protein OG223_20160 [Streptomyces sp. NBC_01478]|uniref:hypothetical protein n=1 Tax=Streptomyces sp. NBC_01478 TaxID=2903882 RepID=UPI002E36E80D|nr:hypothetical protein [Streptomyces sp. NBC_01478]